MGWTTPTTWSVGDVLTASDMNTYVSDNASYLHNGINPVGSVLPYAGSAAPSGWVLCYGQALLKSTYPELNGVLSAASYPFGSDSTHFNVPDLRGRAPFGLDNMGGSAANRIVSIADHSAGTVLGRVGGEDSHTLTDSELSTHSHALNTGSHTHAASVTDPGHAHPLNWHTGTDSVNWVGCTVGGGSSDPGYLFVEPSFTGITVHNSAASIIGSTNSTGSDDPHENMPPFVILSYIIRVA